MGFKERKTQRTKHFYTYVYGWKIRPCTACNGLGKYDYMRPDRSVPDCGWCGGSGKEKYPGPKSNKEV